MAEVLTAEVLDLIDMAESAAIAGAWEVSAKLLKKAAEHRVNCDERSVAVWESLLDISRKCEQRKFESSVDLTGVLKLWHDSARAVDRAAKPAKSAEELFEQLDFSGAAALFLERGDMCAAKSAIDAGLEFETLENVAKGGGVPTLRYRNSDSLDFHEVSVGGLLDMLKQAYQLGKVEGGK